MCMIELTSEHLRGNWPAIDVQAFVSCTTSALMSTGGAGYFAGLGNLLHCECEEL